MKTPIRYEPHQASQGERLCLVTAGGSVIAITPGNAPSDRSAAKAIVRAVNNHENLIGHLHECAELLEQAKRYADKSGDTGMAAFYASGAEQARAAIAESKKTIP